MTLMKNILRSSLASIAYLRYLFPEDNFTETQLAGLKIKSLVPNNNPEIAALTDWLEHGVFDAIEKHYLRALVFCIFSEFNNPKSLLESYTFKFSYPSDGNVGMNFVAKANGTTKEMSYMTREEIQQAWCTMIRGLITLSHTLPQIPAERYIAMRLFYYDDVTPENYEPPGFQQCTDGPDFEFVADAESVEIGGAVKTRHHAVSLRLDTAMPSVGVMESLDPDVEKVMKVCAKSVYLTKNDVAEAIGQTPSSKRVNDIISELCAMKIVSETAGKRGRTVIHNEENDARFKDLLAY